MMRIWFTAIELVLLGALIRPAAALAQDDGPSLGEVARNLRKSKAQQAEQQSQQSGQQQSQQQSQPEVQPARPVIDNDNLAQAIEDARNTKPVAQDKTVFSVDPSGNRLTVKSADVTCSLSFNARASSLLIKPVLLEDLPLDELVKIDGPGSIQDEALQLEIFNGTEWNLREITVGLTLERKPGENAELAARARVVPAAEGVGAIAVERRSDVTLLYHLKTEAKPFSKATFRENIGIAPGPDEDWRWSIVEAKGIRPAGSRAPESLSQPLFGDPLPFVPDTNDPGPGQVTVPLRPPPTVSGLDKQAQEPGPPKITDSTGGPR